MEEETQQSPEQSDELTKPGLPADEHEITLANGDTVTYGELKQGYTRTEDYTVKTQEAADMKRQADEQMAEAAAIKAEADGNLQQADSIRRAVDNDIAWYQNNPDTATWGNYTPEVNRVMGVETSAPSPSPVTPAPAAAPSASTDPEVVERLDKLEKTENERAVDAVMAEVSKIAGSQGNELVTQKLLLNAVRVHQSDNAGTLPTVENLTSLATEIQTDLVDQGIPVPQGTIPPNGSTKPSFSADSPVEVDPAHKKLNLKSQKGQVTDALSGIMRDLASRRG